MSNFTDKAYHPITGLLEEAIFIDDYYGKNKYGVMFSDKKVFRLEDIIVYNKSDSKNVR